MLRISVALTPDDIAVVRGLLTEYQAQLGVDLGYQDFDNELGALPGAYVAPHGRLLLAHLHDVPVGCVALRDIGNGRAEMKRLFVQTRARGAGVASALVGRLIEEARAIGYTEIVLDTLPSMHDAHRLYKRWGFTETLPYSASPVPGTRFLGLRLADR